MPGPRLTVVGLDAATWDVIDPLVAAGDLPNLARLSREGTAATLQSTIHPLTPHAWSSMVTGVNAGRHGIWDFSERDETGYELRFVNGSYRRAQAFWSRLAAGRRVGVVNVPFTFPAPEVDGFSIAGLDAAAREQGMTYPRDLVSRLQQKFGRLELDHRLPVTKAGLPDLEFVRRAAEQKVDSTLWLAEELEPDLLTVVFMAADHMHHLAWPDWEDRGRESAVAETYRILDAALGRLVEARGGDIIVVSDHGGGSLSGVVNLNAWLADQGFLSYMPKGADRKRQLADRLFDLRAHIPQRLRYAVKQRATGLRERVYERKKYSVVDWPRTRAFSYGTFGNIVVNVRGREAEGIVEPGLEYEQVRDAIAERALDLRDPAGERIVAAVHKREDLFDGPQLEKVPDLLVEFTDYRWLGKGNLKRQTESWWDEIELEPGSKASYVGSHRKEGIFILAGPSARSSERTEVDILDVAPTALYVLAEPIPTDLEGRLVFEAIAPELLDARPPEYSDDDSDGGEPDQERASEYSPEEAAVVEDRLRGLGYLD